MKSTGKYNICWKNAKYLTKTRNPIQKYKICMTNANSVEKFKNAICKGKNITDFVLSVIHEVIIIIPESNHDSENSISFRL